MDKIIVDSWHGCYPSNWKGKIIREATAHPAKYSSRLIERIYDHITEMGWVEKCDRIIDPFAGVGLGAMHALRLGLHWTGIELEERWFELAFESYACQGFTKEFWRKYHARPHVIESLRKQRILCPACEARFIPTEKRSKDGRLVSRTINVSDPHMFRGNIQNWARQFSRLPGVGTATMHNGDSRKMSQILKNVQTVAMKSPPFGEAVSGRGIAKNGHSSKDGSLDLVGDRSYQPSIHGTDSGNLGNMRANDTDFDLSIASPPFLQTSGGLTEPKEGGTIDKALHKRHSAGNKHADAYGDNSNQLTNMPEGDLDDVLKGDDFSISFDAASSQGDNFWSAARAIVEQVYLNLKPGGHAVWVVKDYVRNWQIVPFCDQWRRLCESVGFVTLHEHHAELNRHKGSNYTLDGDIHHEIKSSKGFFRRLREAKGTPPIDYEVVFCMEKPKDI